MKTIIINRFQEDKNETEGILSVYDSDKNKIYNCDCLERSFKHNKKRISSIPTGEYPIRLEWSENFRRKLWEIHDVPNRSECKIHNANYWYQLNGCISLGLTFADINHDGEIDVTNSVHTLEEFMKSMGDSVEATIIIVDDL